MQINPIITYFPVFTTNQGIPFLCETVFNHMLAQNSKLAVTLLQFQYVTTLSYWLRISSLQSSLGYSRSNYQDTYELTRYATSILLPAPVAQYIAAFGDVQLASGSVIVPSVPSDPADDADYIFPRQFWEEIHPGQRPPPNYWYLDVDLIVAWNQDISKGGKLDLGLRKIDNLITTGSISMAVSFQAPEDQPSGPGTPIAPCIMTKTEAEVGGAFYFRNYLSYAEWPGEHAEILYGQFSAPPIYARAVIADLCARLFRSTHV